MESVDSPSLEDVTLVWSQMRSQDSPRKPPAAPLRERELADASRLGLGFGQPPTPLKAWLPRGPCAFQHLRGSNPSRGVVLRMTPQAVIPSNPPSPRLPGHVWLCAPNPRATF